MMYLPFLEMGKVAFWLLFSSFFPPAQVDRPHPPCLRFAMRRLEWTVWVVGVDPRLSQQGRCYHRKHPWLQRRRRRSKRGSGCSRLCHAVSGRWGVK